MIKTDTLCRIVMFVCLYTSFNRAAWRMLSYLDYIPPR